LIFKTRTAFTVKCDFNFSLPRSILFVSNFEHDIVDALYMKPPSRYASLYHILPVRPNSAQNLKSDSVCISDVLSLLSLAHTLSFRGSSSPR
jgi:hypothetical protein